MFKCAYWLHKLRYTYPFKMLLLLFCSVVLGRRPLPTKRITRYKIQLKHAHYLYKYQAFVLLHDMVFWLSAHLIRTICFFLLFSLFSLLNSFFSLLLLSFFFFLLLILRFCCTTLLSISALACGKDETNAIR